MWDADGSGLFKNFLTNRRRRNAQSNTGRVLTKLA